MTIDQRRVYSPKECASFKGNFCLIERPSDEKGLRDLPDFFARPLLNLALNPTRTAAYTLRAGIPFGKSGERRANKSRDERKEARATTK